MNGIELQNDFYQLYLSNLNRYLQEPPFTIATLFIKLERTRLPCNMAKDGGERKGSRDSSPPPPSHPPPKIYAGLFYSFELEIAGFWLSTKCLLRDQRLSFHYFPAVLLVFIVIRSVFFFRSSYR